jgi:hypothetical protein
LNSSLKNWATDQPAPINGQLTAGPARSIAENIGHKEVVKVLESSGATQWPQLLLDVMNPAIDPIVASKRWHTIVPIPKFTIGLIL